MTTSSPSKNYNIAVIGLWHLGCVLCAAWSKKNFFVKGFDHEKTRVKNLLKGSPPIFEPGLENSINEAFEKKLLSFTDNINSLSDADFIFLSYDTPVLEDDTSDVSILVKSVKEAARIMNNIFSIPSGKICVKSGICICVKIDVKSGIFSGNSSDLK